MSDHEIQAYVDDLADWVPQVAPPLGAVLAAGRLAAARRRRLRGAMLLAGAVAAVAAVTLGPSAVVQQGPDEELTAGSDVAEPVGPRAPVGMKLVGVGRVVIAVPESWVGTVQPFCVDVEVPSYYVVEPEEHPHRCPSFRDDDRPPADLLRMGPAGSPYLSASCKGMGCPVRLSLDAIVFEVRISQLGPERDELLATMRASLQRLPAGFTTVPGWPNDVRTTGCCRISSEPLGADGYRALLDRDGLEDVVEIGDPELRETVPAQGTVVAVPDD